MARTAPFAAPEVRQAGHEAQGDAVECGFNGMPFNGMPAPLHSLHKPLNAGTETSIICVF